MGRTRLVHKHRRGGGLPKMIEEPSPRFSPRFTNVKKFGQEMLQNTHNIIRIPGGKGSLHAKISGHYSSKPQDLHGLTVRQWLSTKSFEEQYEYSIKMLKEFGWE